MSRHWFCEPRQAGGSRDGEFAPVDRSPIRTSCADHLTPSGRRIHSGSAVQVRSRFPCDRCGQHSATVCSIRANLLCGAKSTESDPYILYRQDFLVDSLFLATDHLQPPLHACSCKARLAVPLYLAWYYNAYLVISITTTRRALCWVRQGKKCLTGFCVRRETRTIK